MKELTKAQLAFLALQTVKVDEDVKAELSPGVYHIDATVRLKGTVKRGEDTVGKVAAAVPWQRIAALAFSKLNGATVESIVREALDSNIDAEDFEKRAKDAVATLVTATTRPISGRTTSALTVEIL